MGKSTSKLFIPKILDFARFKVILLTRTLRNEFVNHTCSCELRIIKLIGQDIDPNNSKYGLHIARLFDIVDGDRY